MAKAKYVNGKDLMLFIGGKAIGLAKSCTLAISAESIDASSKDDGVWKADEIGDLSYTLSTEAMYSADAKATTSVLYDKLQEQMIKGPEGTPIEWTMGVPANMAPEYPEEEGWTAPTVGYKGKMYITSLELNAAKGSVASFSLQGAGYGAIAKLPGA